MSLKIAACRPRVLLLAGSILASLSFAAGPSMAVAIDKERSDAYFGEAQEYLKKGDYNAAVIQLKNALKNDPNNADARRLLGELHLRVGNGPAAEKELRAAMRRGVADIGTKLLLARAYLIQGKLDQVLSLIEDNLTDTAHRAEILLTRGQALLGLRRFEESQSAFHKADEIRPEDVRAKIGLSQVLVNQGKFQDAEREIDIAISRDPKSARALVLKGELRRLQKDLDGAIANFDQAIAIDGGLLLARLGRAASLIDLNQDDKAQADLQAVFKRAPKHPLVAYLSALTMAKKKDYIGAQDALQSVGSRLENHLPSLFLSGATHYALNQLEQALRALTRYVAEVPRNARARKLLGATLIRNKAPEQAIETLEPLVTSRPKDAQLFTLLGSAYMQARKFSEGMEMFRRAAEIAPNVASIRTRLALGSLARGKADDAIGELEQAIDLDPDSRQAAILLALVKLRKKDYDGALEAAEKLQKIMPDNPLPRNIAGAAYLGKGDIPAARKAFEDTLKNKPDFHPARMNLAQIDLNQGKFEAARNHYKNVIERDAKHTGAMMALADIAMRENNREKAIDWLKRASDANPKSVGPRLRLIGLYGRFRNFEKAVSVARGLALSAPDDPRALEALGRTETASGNAISAIETFRRLANQQPKSGRVLGLVAGAQIAAKDTDGARRSLRAAIERDPNYLPVQIALIELEARAGRFAEALSLAQAMRDKHPKSVAGDMLAGDVYMRQKLFEDAIVAYSAGLAKSNSGGLAIRRFNARRRAGQSQPALDELQKWVDQYGDRTAHHVLASSYISSGNFDAAIRESEKLAAKEKDNPVLLNNLAWLYQRKGDSRAVEFAEQALKRSPKSPAIMDTLGWILTQHNQLDRALEMLKKANALAPDQGEIRYHLAVALHKSGNNTEARMELRKLIDSEVKFSKLEAARTLLKQLGGG